MIGSLLLGRPNIIEREAVARLFNRIAFGSLNIKRNWFPALLVEILQAQTPLVALRDAPMGLLYVMHSPNFVPQFYKPLDYIAIGSGQGVIEHIDGIHDMIFAGDTGEGHMEAMWLTTSIQDFVKHKNIQSVGGMFTMLKLTSKGVVCIGHKTEAITDELSFELAFENNRWLQRNLSTGKEIELVLPWELDPAEMKEKTFDDNRFGNL